MQSEQYIYRILHLAVPIMLIIVFPLFFLSGPNYYSPRSFQAFWKLGHIIYFSLLSYWLYGIFSKKNISIIFSFISIFFFSLILGIAIEFFQFLIDNTPRSIYDILLNQLGVLLTFSFFTKDHLLKNKKILSCTRIIVIFFLIISLSNLVKSLIDEYIASSQFPLLSDLETPFELERWIGESKQIDENVVRHGKKSLRVSLHNEAHAGTYADIILLHFPRNWSKYKTVHWSVFNPLEEELTFNCRIHDKYHKKTGYDTDDRFIKTFVLHHGWNDLSISLAEVKNAPKGRTMDMNHIESLHFFTKKIPEQQNIYIDYVYLQP